MGAKTKGLAGAPPAELRRRPRRLRGGPQAELPPARTGLFGAGVSGAGEVGHGVCEVSPGYCSGLQLVDAKIKIALPATVDCRQHGQRPYVGARLGRAKRNATFPSRGTSA